MRVVVAADEVEDGVRDNAVLVLVAVRFGVISDARVEVAHLRSRDSIGIVKDSFTRDSHQPSSCIKLVRQMGRPAFPAVLDVLHLEETDRVAAAEHSESCRQTVAQEIEVIGRLMRPVRSEISS